MNNGTEATILFNDYYHSDNVIDIHSDILSDGRDYTIVDVDRGKSISRRRTIGESSQMDAIGIVGNIPQLRMRIWGNDSFQLLNTTNQVEPSAIGGNVLINFNQLSFNQFRRISLTLEERAIMRLIYLGKSYKINCLYPRRYKPFIFQPEKIHHASIPATSRLAPVM